MLYTPLNISINVICIILFLIVAYYYLVPFSLFCFSVDMSSEDRNKMFKRYFNSDPKYKTTTKAKTETSHGEENSDHLSTQLDKNN